MIDTGPKFYTVPSAPPPYMTLRSRSQTFMLMFYVKVFRTSLFSNLVMDLFHVWYDDRCWSKILFSTIPNPVHDFKIKVTDLEFLYLSLCLSFYSVCSCEAFDGLIHVWHGDRYWSKISYGTQVIDSEFLYKSFVINVLQFQFFLQSLQWILFICGMMIEPCLKFYAVPSQSQCMTLRSRSQTEFVCVKSLQCQLLQTLWLIWIMFGMNGYKILKCFRKEKRVSGELPCPATCLIMPLRSKIFPIGL